MDADIDQVVSEHIRTAQIPVEGKCEHGHGTVNTGQAWFRVGRVAKWGAYAVDPVFA